MLLDAVQPGEVWADYGAGHPDAAQSGGPLPSDVVLSARRAISGGNSRGELLEGSCLPTGRA
jgi:hypothetical protein